MKIFLPMMFVLFGMLQMNERCDKKNEQPATNITMAEPLKTPTKFDRLPTGIALNTEVEGRAVKNEKGEFASIETTTVEKKLTELKAKYKRGTLVDAKGKEIRFFNRLCRGTSQGFEQDRREREKSENELAALKKKYTVIILYCDQRRMM